MLFQMKEEQICEANDIYAREYPHLIIRDTLYHVTPRALTHFLYAPYWLEI